MGKKPLVIARTGDVQYAPENTLLAFESAIAKGADGIELDVHPTADGEIVVHHYYCLGSTDDGEGLVCEHTLADLQSLDSGTWFDARFAGASKPALPEVLDLCRGRTQFEIDVKGSSLGFLRRVVGEIEAFGLVADVELTTAHYPLLMHVKKLCRGLRVGTFFCEPPDWMPVRLAQSHALDWARLLDIDVVHLNTVLITEEFVGSLHQHGFVAYGSNLDSRAQIQRGLELGIDSFSTGSLETALKLRDAYVALSSGRSTDARFPSP
jgi:glycerophosphoryl diester phosphodiesterase